MTVVMELVISIVEKYVIVKRVTHEKGSKMLSILASCLQWQVTDMLSGKKMAFESMAVSSAFDTE